MPGEEEIRKLVQYRPPEQMHEPDPEWVAYFERAYSEALAYFEDQPLEMRYQGESPITLLANSIYGIEAGQPRGIPRQAVNLSPEAMGLLSDALDATLEHYGTSEHADPRGFWMKLDGETS